MQIQEHIRLKGVGDGVTVMVDPSCSQELLEDELSHVFKKLQPMKANVEVKIDAQGDHTALTRKLEIFLKDKFKIDIVPRPNKPSFSENIARRQDIHDSWHQYQSDVLMLAGRVRSGQKVTARQHLIIMGDVNPGAEVIAGGDILVMGSLCGVAMAGQPNDEDALILAIDFRPTQVQIGGRVAAGMPATKAAAEFACVENNVIVVDDYLKAKPFKRLAWPQVR